MRDRESFMRDRQSFMCYISDGERERELSYSRVLPAAREGDATLLTAAVCGVAPEVVVEVPVLWLLGATAVVLHNTTRSASLTPHNST